jgi:putative DNA primase/helicase
MPASYLTGRNGPCPLCNAGKDRFRFTNLAGDGRFICSTCTPQSGSGLDLLKEWLRIESFAETVKLAESKVRTARFEMPKTEELSVRAQGTMRWMWGVAARALTGFDIVSRYLQWRKITLIPGPTAVRRLPQHYKHGLVDKPDALVARFVAADDSRAVLHTTTLEEPFEDHERLKKYVLGAKVPNGGAVRLMPAGEILGVAEGLETALSASLLYSVPVWSTLDAGHLMHWIPPNGVHKVIIFADFDKNQVGQRAAEVLASRLRKQLDTEVRFPEGGLKDFNDQLRL